MPTTAPTTLLLRHVLDAAGLDIADVLLVRHTYTADGLSPLTIDDELLAYTRVQGISNKIGAEPGSLWLCFLADGQRRSRFIQAYRNAGEIVAERTTSHRTFDLHPIDILADLRGRLVVQWGRDTVNWAKSARAGAAFPVEEIADRAAVPFPGYDNVLVSHSTLCDVVAADQYRDWRTALSQVHGIYAITDTTDGRLYVGKADGNERLLQRWRAYAATGHGGNVELKALMLADPGRHHRFQLSILRVFSPSTPQHEVDAAESHYKRALMTRAPFGLNGG